MHISFDSLFGYFRIALQSHSSLCSFRSTAKLSQKYKSNLPKLLFNHYLTITKRDKSTKKTKTLITIGYFF